MVLCIVCARRVATDRGAGGGELYDVRYDVFISLSVLRTSLCCFITV